MTHKNANKMHWKTRGQASENKQRIKILEKLKEKCKQDAKQVQKEMKFVNSGIQDSQVAFFLHFSLGFVLHVPRVFLESWIVLFSEARPSASTTVAVVIFSSFFNFVMF